MKKIISLFQRNYETDRLCRDEVVPGAEWVLAGEGIATVKFDGTCCLVRERKLYKRYDAKHGKTPPENFEPAQDPDPVTGHWPGWIPVGDESQSRWHKEAFDLADYQDGTYELVGPKINGNPYGLLRHELWKHGEVVNPEPVRTYEGLRTYLAEVVIEGIVFHHPDGRMVKIKRKDFGFKWP